ncbi:MULTISPECIES: leucyl aminopeptidase [unclassified Gemella]|uniref:leucyl aminopeptidase n=1 Tax=unclassified Gemella TaxID=2624949 RepID=UPI00107363A6|nr:MULTISPECIES: leucyl aminopeptidase [unclassified Gemella]MBF0710601.1 leucyl aminopeptidase [Gemella sp. GL1.1]MBF0746420.1 leucyl aminopeptidase [Gemella sp. 19428wG2_WT2a]NYS27945.1 leucyl aminopeptidase [Gemella sp. GL1]TFU60203.1 leucyl aminopeptidase [Gemella sp. WT2a]
MELKYNTSAGVNVTELFKGDSQNSELFRYAEDKKLFSGEIGQVFTHLPFNSSKEAFLGLGNADEFIADTYREAYFKLLKDLIGKKEYEFTISIQDDVELLKAVVEGLYHATYEFDKYKTLKEDKEQIRVHINTQLSEKDFNMAVQEAKDVIDSIFFARDLVNERAEYLYPETLANIAKEKLSAVGVDVKVYDEKQAEEMGLVAFLSVGRGSSRKPRFIVMKYLNNPDAEEVLGLVGKGVTYDTGGYSLKPSDSMTSMNSDMAGAATVIAAMELVAKRKLKTNLVAVVAACENMVSSSSYKPGDVIYSLSGKTIEVDNTDAEGRITLADAIYYTTKELGVTKVIDIATLTGACLVALAEDYTGALSNKQDFFDDFKEAAKNAGERVWQMPMDNSYRERNKSRVADIKNTGGRFGGMITAGLFIEEFLADKNIPWIHLDIAGTSYLSMPYKYQPVNATGVHVKALYNLLNK